MGLTVVLLGWVAIGGLLETLISRRIALRVPRLVAIIVVVIMWPVVVPLVLVAWFFDAAVHR